MNTKRMLELLNTPVVRSGAPSLAIEIDAKGAEDFATEVSAHFDSLPFDARQHFANEFFRLLHGDTLKLSVCGSTSTADAGNNVVRLGISGGAEILAAAVAASDEYLRLRHNRPPV